MTRSWNIVMTRIMEHCDDKFHGGPCLCVFSSRHKSVKQRGGCTAGQPPSAGQPPQPPAKHKVGGDKAEKGDKQQKRPQTPFHHRSPACRDDAAAMETEAGQRMSMRGQDAARFPGMRASDAAAKPPQLHGGGGGGGGSSELPGSSPQPPPLSPHPCEGDRKSVCRERVSSPV